jgi:hypothetical protein
LGKVSPQKILKNEKVDKRGNFDTNKDRNVREEGLVNFVVVR